MQTNIESNECCQQKTKQQDSHEDLSHHAHHSSNNSLIGLATSATLHCLTGCAIGELAGLMIGVSLGLGVWNTMILATMLGFLSGYTLGLLL